MLLIFVLLAAVLSLVLCLTAGLTGITLAAFFLLGTVLSFIAVTVVYLILIFLLLLPVDKSKVETEEHPVYRRLMHATVDIFLFYCNVSWDIEGLEKLPDTPYLLVSNHRSGFDPLIMMAALKKHRLNFISKPENMKIPYVGSFLVKTGSMAIDRNDDRKALKTILAVADQLKKGVASYCIYPEGTRSKTCELLPFRPGCFKAAQRAKAPVVVAVTEGTERILKRTPFRRSHATIRICEVLDAETVAAHKTVEISEMARDIMLNNL